MLRDLDEENSTAVRRWSATLDLDHDDPYLFDHPLDHVPGMALICGVFQLVRATGTPVEGIDRRIRTTLRFPLFCELERTIRVAAADTGGPEGALTVRAEQAGTAVCTGHVEFGAVEAPAVRRPTARLLPAETPAAEPALVHRRLAQNVLISEMVPTGADQTVAVRRPFAGHPLASPPGEPDQVELVIDAARQYATMINHVAHHASPDLRFVLLDLDADLPGTVHGDVELSWTPIPPAKGRRSLVFDVLVDGVRRGHVGFRYYAAPEAVYQRLRHPATPATNQEGHK
ncbi:AfsA-related hotdog domain-containing protein [Micromonospora rosaria]|nr:AfsA-related hotdog domain-containing protein [Micromonospora rosaria]